MVGFPEITQNLCENLWLTIQGLCRTIRRAADGGFDEPKVNAVIFRQNTEGLYAGLEWTNPPDQVRDALERRVKAEGLEEIISNVMVPSERISEIRGGQKRVRERKIYPGYIMVEIEAGDGREIPETAWFAIRETPGIGDFLGYLLDTFI